MTATLTPDLAFDQAVLANPYPTYASLRATAGLVRHRADGYYLVSRYDDVREAAMRTDDFSSRITDIMIRSVGLGRGFERLMGRFGPIDVLAIVDAPMHLVHRKLTTKHLAREPVADTLARATPRIEARLDRFVRNGGGDFAAEVAETLPVELALETLGFPLSDARRVKHYSDHAVALLSGTVPGSGALPVFVVALELYAYSLARLLWARRRGGTGTALGDAIVNATLDGTLGVREGASIVMQLLIAGADSTTSLLGAAARMLAESPELADRLRADPSLVPVFLEECLRLESPFQGHFRVVRRETELAGTRLYPGDRLMLLWASANRDPAAFEAPDQVSLERKANKKPQLAFGQGIHLCVGAGLARAASRLVIERLLAKTRSISLSRSSLEYKPSGFSRTLAAVPLTVRAA